MCFLKTKNSLNKIFKAITKLKTNKGFSLIELLVVLAIITLITSIILINHSIFNRGVVLESLAYEIALTTRQAQFFSINVLASGNPGERTFDTGYGIYFLKDPTNGKNKQFIMFADTLEDGKYTISQQYDETIEVYNITRGNIIKDICVDGSCGKGELHVTFKRPDPDAIIFTDSPSDCNQGGCGYAEIYIGSTNPKVKDKIITIGVTGQISISTSQN